MYSEFYQLVVDVCLADARSFPQFKAALKCNGIKVSAWKRRKLWREKCRSRW